MSSAWQLGNRRGRPFCVLAGKFDDIINSTGVDDHSGSLFEVGSMPAEQERTEVAATGLCQFKQDRQGENTTSHVRADWLAQPIRVSDQIEYVVNELERHTEFPSELAEAVDVLIR